METVRSADGTEIAFDRWGAGPTLVLTGGALSDRRAAVPIAELLGERFTVIAFDRRGRGDSGDTLPYAVEREIEDIEALFAAVGGSAVLFGHSSGAVLSLRAALAGLPIPRLALYEPPFIVDRSRPPLPDGYVERLEELVAKDRPGDAVEYFMTVGVAAPARVVEQMRTSAMWPSLEAIAHTIAYDARIMGDDMRGEPLGREWSRVTEPALVMDGGASPAWQRTSARALAEVLPNAEYVELEGQDHGPTPDGLAPLLIEFLGGFLGR